MRKKFLGLAHSYRYTIILILILLIAAFLRLYHLGSLPPAPYWEEVALGYDSYSILKTGRDHHGNLLPIIAFESFGDWKPSLYFYLAVPSIAVFGLYVWAVRLPSAVAGIGIVWLMYFLPQVMSRLDCKKKSWHADTLKKIGLLAAAVVAIEPWAITFSRAAWEVNVATFLILAGVVLFLHSMQQVSKATLVWQLGSVLLFALSMYCYHAARLIAPLLLVTLMCWTLWQNRGSKKQLRVTLGQIIVSGVLFTLIIAPLIVALSSPQISSRFLTENVFSDIQVIERSNYLKELSSNSFISRIQFHRYALFAREILKNYSTYLSPDFLFVTGDSNMRHNVGYFALLYPFDIVFVLAGFVFLWKKQRSILVFMIIWLLIGLLPATISRPNPHALRALPTLPIWILLIAYGISYVVAYGSERCYSFFSTTAFFKKIHLTDRNSWIQVILSVVIITLFAFQLLAFLLYYQTIYPQRAASWWQSGYQQLFQSLDSLQQQTDYAALPIYISRFQGRPAMYDWFYHQTDPREVQAQQSIVAKDQSEFLSFQNKTYFRNFSEVVQRPALVAATPEEWAPELSKLSLDSYQILDQINARDGSVVWQIVGLK